MDIRNYSFLVAVVEDDEGLRVATENLLKSAGYRARGFASAEDFLQSGLPVGAGCLILDVRLPGLSGLELQEFLGWNGRRIPVVFITAQPDSDCLEAVALHRGAVAFLYKPFSDEALLRAVRSACDSPIGAVV